MPHSSATDGSADLHGNPVPLRNSSVRQSPKLGYVFALALLTAALGALHAEGSALANRKGVAIAAAPPNPSRLAFETGKKAGPLAAVVALEQRRDELSAGPLESQWFDTIATWRLFVGDHRGALEANSRANAAFRRGRPVGGPGGEALEGRTPQPAAEAILRLAAERRVVMMNEEHRSGRERAFANEILEPLFRAGFTHLALETLADRTDELRRRGYPVVKDGFYTQDPVLGDLVRRALSLGMKVVAYEADMSKAPSDLDPRDPVARTNWREAAQARNLAAILESDPKARIVVWCGRHHLSEDVPEPPNEDGEDTESTSPPPPAWTPMGGIFASTTGIDPLTIDLMMMTEGEAPSDERPAYRAAVEDGLVPEPVIFFDDGGIPWSPIDSIDAAVFFPRTQWDDTGRPSWLSMGGTRRRVTDAWANGDAPRPSESRPFVLEAQPIGEADNAVPLDRVIWRGGEVPALYLRPGISYMVRLRDPEGSVVSENSPLRIDESSSTRPTDETKENRGIR